MRKPKPPTPRSVSATLAAADFRAWNQYRAEGFQAEWAPGIGAIVLVRFVTDDAGMRSVALSKMAGRLRYKGWAAQRYEDHLIVTAKDG